MRFNSHKENFIFDKKIKNGKDVLFSNVVPNNVTEEIFKIKNNKESVYIFNSGDKAEFLYERSCVNDLSFNYFQIYNKSVYFAYIEIKSMLVSFCKQKILNTNKLFYYITSEYEDEFLEDYWYDCGGIGSTSFCGYWFLETKKDSFIKINSIKYKVSLGDIIMFESGLKTEFFGINKAIVFNIATLSQIKGQYPQKWTPISTL
jgi:hypothetical protein